MDIKNKAIQSIKGAYKNIRVSRVKPTGVILTRLLILVMILPILLVIIQYIMSFISGYVSDEANKIINVGINIIDHVFIPSVLTALVGFLGLWLDSNHNGIPDKLEDKEVK